MSATDTPARNPTVLPQLTKKDFTSDQEVRWCPGCGDYAILAAMQSFLADAGSRPESTVFISGIGCSSRFPYYMDTYGMHTIHGRAPAVATGLAVARPDLDIFVVTGDGDALSIGGNHLIHVLRRNVNLTILLFNNQIYGLTKGQYSPTSPVGTVAKSTPYGSIDEPLTPATLALGAEATFVARTIDRDRKHLTETLAAAHAHRGAALVEILQNCPVFNDDAFSEVTDRETKDDEGLRLVVGEPMVFGANRDKGVAASATGGIELIQGEDVAERALVHDPTMHDPTRAFALSRMRREGGPTPIGVLRQVERPVYEEEVVAQVDRARREDGADDLEALLTGGTTWKVD
ncbi:MAG: 2-oxoglutarate ferredoxin oxidoreductase subunit beta [Nitriliruptoraceae bacterium]|jgi:2-oxoglutarate ferredoxin oxidoreductase subunit beta